MNAKWRKNTLCFALLAAVGAAQAQQFTDVTESAGAQHFLRSTNLAWGDYDSDGDFDIYITNWATQLTPLPINALLRNEGDGTFTDQTTAARLGAENFLRDGGNSTAAAWADYDNDGDLDLYLADFFEQDYLLENEEGAFTEVGHNSLGIDTEKRGNETAVAWGDYDNDGYLDLYLGAYYFENELYLNNAGDATFARVANQPALNDKRDTNDVNWVDYDNDGDLDLFLVNREQENALFRNDLDLDGSVTEVFCALSLANMEIGQKGAWADYDNDGDLDLYLANVGANALYRNDGGDLFVDVAATAGVRHSGSDWLSAAVVWADYNGDGYADLFLASGGDRPDTVERLQTDVLFENNKDGTFRNATTDAFPFFASLFTVHMAAAWGDYDGNGSPDLYAVDSNVGLTNRLYRNDTPGANFIRVRVSGKGPQNGGTNRDGIGTQVRLLNAAGDTLAYQQVLPGPNAPELIFGTPEGGVIYTVEAFFPRSGSLARRTAEGGERVDIAEP
jgi:hypothetical protein